MSQAPLERDYREASPTSKDHLDALNGSGPWVVKRLKHLKQARELSFHDPAQEKRVQASLRQANGGPLSEQGLQEIYGLIMEWSKPGTAARPPRPAQVACQWCRSGWSAPHHVPLRAADSPASHPGGEGGICRSQPPLLASRPRSTSPWK